MNNKKVGLLENNSGNKENNNKKWYLDGSGMTPISMILSIPILCLIASLIPAVNEASGANRDTIGFLFIISIIGFIWLVLKFTVLVIKKGTDHLKNESDYFICKICSREFYKTNQVERNVCQSCSNIE